MTIAILLTFLIPLAFFASVTGTPVKRKPRTTGKVYKIVLLDKEGNRIKGYTYIK
jgi:hypothetical protein